jgi:hypothetical protein
MDDRDELTARPAYGGAVHGRVRESLERAAASYHDDREAAGRWLQQAAAADPDALAVYFARYKFHFYRNQLAEAEAAAREGLAAAAAQGSFPADWRILTPESAAWSPAAGPERFYLFSLKALAFIRLRRGDTRESLALLAKLAEIDPADQVGAEVIRALHQGAAHAA